MNLNARISIAGHRGLVGSAILRNREIFFEAERPEYVFLVAKPPTKCPMGPSELSPDV